MNGRTLCIKVTAVNMLVLLFEDENYISEGKSNKKRRNSLEKNSLHRGYCVALNTQINKKEWSIPSIIQIHGCLLF